MKKMIYLIIAWAAIFAYGCTALQIKPTETTMYIKLTNDNPAVVNAVVNLYAKHGEPYKILTTYEMGVLKQELYFNIGGGLETVVYLTGTNIDKISTPKVAK